MPEPSYLARYFQRNVDIVGWLKYLPVVASPECILDVVPIVLVVENDPVAFQSWNLLTRRSRPYKRMSPFFTSKTYSSLVSALPSNAIKIWSASNWPGSRPKSCGNILHAYAPRQSRTKDPLVAAIAVASSSAKQNSSVVASTVVGA